MSKMSKQKARARRKTYAKPSLPRAIGANDNQQAAGNDNAPRMIRGHELTDGQRIRFARAEEMIAATSLDTRREGHRMMDVLDREIEAALAGKSAATDLEELRGLEALRGLDIGISNRDGTKGAPRAQRDGLETLLTSKSITSTQHVAGMYFRADFELLDPEKGLTPPPIDQTRRIVRGGEGFAAKRTERELFIRDLEALIQEEDRTCRGANGVTEVERVGWKVWTLREVAGKGSNLRQLSGSGSVIARMTDALSDALDCAAIAYGLE